MRGLRGSRGEPGVRVARASGERMTEIAREVIPGVSAVLDPVAQVRQRVDQLRSGAGVNNAEFLSLSFAMGQVVEIDSVQSMDYRNQTLSIEFVPEANNTPTMREAVASRAAEIGLELRFVDGRAIVRRKAGS